MGIHPVFFFSPSSQTPPHLWMSENKKKDFKEDTFSVLVACSSTTRHFCMHNDAHLTSTGGSSDRVVGFHFILKKNLCIFLYNLIWEGFAESNALFFVNALNTFSYTFTSASCPVQPQFDLLATKQL